LIRGAGGIEKEKKDRDAAQPQPDERSNRALSGLVDCHWDVMEVGHARSEIKNGKIIPRARPCS
jgi:hypothetical protein